MSEFTTVSASSSDPGSLVAQLNEKSAEGWEVVSIVPTGGDITAFLSRSNESAALMAAEVAIPSISTSSEPERSPASEPASEPAGWASAPEAALVPEPAPAPQPAASAPASNPAPAPTPAAAPVVPAGWYADPAGRFDLRYWDGGTWTEHVSRAGQQFTDPPVA